MQVKELIEKLKAFSPEANVCVRGDDRGRSPFLDVIADGIYETEDYELSEVSEPSVLYKSELEDDDEENKYRKVVVLLEIF